MTTNENTGKLHLIAEKLTESEIKWFIESVFDCITLASNDTNISFDALAIASKGGYNKIITAKRDELVNESLSNFWGFVEGDKLLAVSFDKD